MKAFALRIGLYRVAALCVAGALALELVRQQVLSADSAGGVACALGEIVFLGLAVAVFRSAHREQLRRPPPNGGD